ncbi:hypothetical protein Bhyg_13955 [Pseudolycoriella hygida]|uniref:Non-homologous end-joining factor 1 n=1 Tax=Pseudolycoriella hygida TaxID=35572 RepID=A0A9Q0MQK8_9DIPT|nr:hypothetical protein Bhyg_13955 [Pseudolycoriella hygida]
MSSLPILKMDWRTIVIAETNQTFVISIASTSTGSFVFNLSDFKELWLERIEWQEILCRAKSENPFMNVDDDENALEQTIFSLANQYTFSFNGNERLLKAKYYIGGVPFHFQWKLMKSSSDQFFEEITKKLLVTLLNVEDQRNELIAIVKRKDVEIRHVATQPFDQKEFEKQFELNSSKFELEKGGNLLYNTMKTLGNYDKCMKRNACIDALPVVHGPSPSKIVRYNKNKEDKATRKFKTRKGSKIKYDNSSELMSDDSDETEQNLDAMADKKETNDGPKRKLKAKLNL